MQSSRRAVAPDWYASAFDATSGGLMWAERTGEEVERALKALGLAPGARILDLGCGAGRHAIELANRGFDVIGVDISAELIEIAEGEAQIKEVDVQFLCADLRALDYREAFEAVLNLHDGAIGYLENDAENQRTFQTIARALRPGGRFALEACYVAEVVLPTLQDRSWFDVADMLVLAQRCYDPTTSRLHVEYRWIRDGATETRTMSARIYSCGGILRLLAEAGFADVQIYGSLAREPFRLGSGRLLAVATKRKRA